MTGGSFPPPVSKWIEAVQDGSSPIPVQGGCVQK